MIHSISSKTFLFSLSLKTIWKDQLANREMAKEHEHFAEKKCKWL